MDERERDIVALLNRLRIRKSCEWCKHPHEEVLPKVGLCSHCNRIRNELRKLEAKAEAHKKEHDILPRNMDRRLKVLKEKMKEAKSEGIKYGKLYEADISDLDLERELCLLGERLLGEKGKELFWHEASSLSSKLSQNHRRYLFYILSLFNREYERRYRRSIAEATVTLHEIVIE